MGNAKSLFGGSTSGNSKKRERDEEEEEVESIPAVRDNADKKGGGGDEEEVDVVDGDDDNQADESMQDDADEDDEDEATAIDEEQEQRMITESINDAIKDLTLADSLWTESFTKWHDVGSASKALQAQELYETCLAKLLELGIGSGGELVEGGDDDDDGNDDDEGGSDVGYGGGTCPKDLMHHTIQNPFYLYAIASARLSRCQESTCLFAAAQKTAKSGTHVFPNCVEARLQSARASLVCARNERELGDVCEDLTVAVVKSGELEKSRSSVRLAVARKRLEARLKPCYNNHGDEEEEEDDQWLLGEAVEEELDKAAEARDLLILLLCQNPDLKPKDPTLKPFTALELMKMARFEVQLSNHVLRYPHQRDIEAPGLKRIPWRLDVPFVKAVESALPPELFKCMYNAFNPESIFWKEHRYGPLTPYFSYVSTNFATLRTTFNTKSTTTLITTNTTEITALDQIIHRLFQIACTLFPDKLFPTKRTYTAEWWAHARPHCHGHQLHFDSDDEGKKRNKHTNTPRHPVVSSVLYISHAHQGGPTLVTNQRLGDPLADRGWIVHPEVNRYVVFDGSVLHGVVPGRGSVVRGCESRRVTFMVAFWEDLEVKDSAPVVDAADADGATTFVPGTAGKVPMVTSGTNMNWPKLFLPPKPAKDCEAVDPEKLAAVRPIPVEEVWSRVGSDDTTSHMNEAEEETEEDGNLDERSLEFGCSTSLIGLPSYEKCFQGF